MRLSRVEADHGKLKQLIRPVRGFKTLRTAYATIEGFEVMRALRKGQARVFALQGGTVGEARIVERAFGVGSCVLTEAIEWPQGRLASAEAQVEHVLLPGLPRPSEPERPSKRTISPQWSPIGHARAR